MEDLFADNDYNLWMHLMQTRRAMRKARKIELSQYGISPSQGGILYYIQALGMEATPAAVARWLFREPHSVSGILKDLEKKGLIRKFSDLKRKNMIRLELTDKGKEAYQLSAKRESIHRIMSPLSMEQKRCLWEVLKILRDTALKEIGVGRPLPFHTVN